MEAVLLSVHVLAAIVFVGGSAVAASLFPRYAPIAVSVPAGPAAGERDANGRRWAVAAALHRITRGYSVAALVVPVAGIVLAVVQGRMGEIWINISMVLTIAAGGLLALQIQPRQRAALAEPGDPGRLRTLSMLAGIYNLLWAIVVVLMIARPGAD
ncbi:hypothetical protein ITP53_39675 [Nonomuraea sp. K274]|uniref:Integral membrane protein n=1 Tax=Nonomuraea cypriaca TaxID=1187855 RepID=A0A931AK82_9ACTN|nr:hypothetical protein [Nonomuraea cypriaca]MBF8191710.1 hypothetical protein [Nonomuraea cypriaca]